MDNYLGEIRPVGFNFAPHGWALCEGQLLPISQNTALFSLIGTFYGGDGRSTFALPDLRGRIAISSGQGPGLSDYTIGEQGGVEAVTLTASEMPAHAHQVTASSAAATSYSPTSNVPAKTSRNVYAAGGAGTMAADSLGLAGQNVPHENHQPFLSVIYIIALTGIFPPHP